MTDDRDNLFAGDGPGTLFRFDEQVVRVFPDMISRSVPGYGLIVPMTGLLARRYAQNDTDIFDLGCSLGATSLAISQAVDRRGVRIIAVDNSSAMVKEFSRKLAATPPRLPVVVRNEDVLDTQIRNASVVVLNFTLQFLDPAERQGLIDRAAAGLCDGGALILSEKIRFPDADEQLDQDDWHQAFKRSQGYSELEISRKRSALENVLQPDDEATHSARCCRAGLSRPRRWFQCFAFASYIAFK